MLSPVWLILPTGNTAISLQTVDARFSIPAGGEIFFCYISYSYTLSHLLIQLVVQYLVLAE